MFVGQRREGFSVNLGEVFDLIRTNPVGDTHGEQRRDQNDEAVTDRAIS